MNFEYQTDRLILKVLNNYYSREVLDFQCRNRELFERYEPTRPDNFYTSDFQASLLKSEYKLTLKLKSVRFYVFLKEHPDVVIGTVCLHDIRNMPYSCSELGYKFDKDYHHLGYAAEAIGQLIKIAFTGLNLHRIFAMVMEDNEPSIRLLRSLGFEYEGTERESALICGRWTDHMRFTLLNRTR
jgi:ribosomal-protein-alanine N-acetyltransferase